MKYIMIALLAIGFLAVGRAHSQMACSPLDDIAAALMAPKYGESPVFEGTDTTGTKAFIIFANPKTGTWSVVGIPTPGVGCLSFAGKGFKLPREFKSPAKPPAGKAT